MKSRFGVTFAVFMLCLSASPGHCTCTLAQEEEYFTCLADGAGSFDCNLALDGCSFQEESTAPSAAQNVVTSRQAMTSSLDIALIKANNGGIATHLKEMPDQCSLLTQADDETLPSSSSRYFAKGEDRNALWGKGFYQVIKDAGRTQDSFGGYLGYDHFYSSGMISGVAAYSQSILKPSSQGSGHVDFASVIFHGIAQIPKGFFIEYGLVGSMNFNHIKRNAFIGFAKSSFKSYTLDPHIDLGYDWKASDWCILELYVANDFVFNFQPSYTEHGSTSFNRYCSPQNAGLYRLEPGVSFYEYWKKDWGMIVLQEKVGYVRKQVMYGSSSDITFVDFSLDSTVASGLVSQNCVTASAQLFGRLNSGPFISFHYRGEWGSQYQLNEGRVRLGSYF